MEKKYVGLKSMVWGGHLGMVSQCYFVRSQNNRSYGKNIPLKTVLGIWYVCTSIDIIYRYRYRYR